MFSLVPLKEENKKSFKKDMQEAFQLGACEELENVDGEILPEDDINQSLNKKGAVAYQALLNDKMVGGAIVVIDDVTKHNHLDFLYVKSSCQGQGIGQKIWNALEERYPDTLIWETGTPYFEKRNIHFYINCCGFCAVEFYNPKHKDPHLPETATDDDCFFRFEKRM